MESYGADFSGNFSKDICYAGRVEDFVDEGILENHENEELTETSNDGVTDTN